MIKAIIDTSPLIFLGKIRRLSLLSVYKLFVPFQVEEEILKGRERHQKDSLLIAEFLKNQKISIVEVGIRETLPSYLGKGEQAVISYAVNSGIKDVLIDEGKARTVARFYKLRPKGTLGILNDALKREAITKKELEGMVFDLVQMGYRIREDVLIEFLKSIREKQM